MKSKQKILLLLISIFTFSQLFAQSIDIENQNKNFRKDIDVLVEELQFMYDTDQAIREYTLFKTYNKAITDSIESLPQEKVEEYIIANKYKSDSLSKRIHEKYILPIDELNTERIIELTKTYGFPSRSRIKRVYSKNLDEEFNPSILIVHAPKKYWDELKTIINKEFENERLSRCEYGHIIWHLNGRKNIQDLLDNGFELVTNENGQTVLKAVDCE